MPLDWEKALQNTDGSEELLIELAGVFLDECPEMMRQIRASIDAGDAPGLQLAAHSLKGSARIFAAPPATDAAHRLELMGAEANLQDAESAWSLLLETIEDLVVALAERSCGQGSPAQPGQEE
jgi:HPt (histidine-containing phosphotransfer) domain-containing protein